MDNVWVVVVYSLFILSINGLSEPKKAYAGNLLAILAMGIAIFFGMYNLKSVYFNGAIISLTLGGIIGLILAYKISMSYLPQMVALLNGFGGIAAGLISLTELLYGQYMAGLLLLVVGIGFFTFGGSLAAFIKLSNFASMFDRKVLRYISGVVLLSVVICLFYTYMRPVKYGVLFASLVGLLGLFFVLPIGGADMPIVISLLNSFSGWCTVFIGIESNEVLLVVVGSLVGASGLILSYIMTKAMHRSLRKILFESVKKATDIVQENKPIQQGTARDAAFLMENANKVIIVPGYGMAAAGAQFEVYQMANILKEKYNVEVKYAIHPVAGRMPGHMNVLLAEADVSSDDVFELKDINQEFSTTDVVYVIGANDITNPLAKTDENSPIYQMPILEVELAKKVLFVKRSLGQGYSGIDNPLFYAKNTIMLLGDAKEVTKAIVANLEHN